jgi:hypothetical protein
MDHAPRLGPECRFIQPLSELVRQALSYLAWLAWSIFNTDCLEGKVEAFG